MSNLFSSATPVDSIRGRTVLSVVQCAAMIELAVMPIWVSVLMQHFGLDAQQAGSLVSFYVMGAVVSGLVTAPFFSRLNSGAIIATLGTLLGAAMFYRASHAPAFGEMAVVHGLAGLSLGPVLAVTEGTIGRSRNPHRLLAISHIALNLFAAAMLGIMPTLLARFGGALFYEVVAFLMFSASVIALFSYPAVPARRGEAAPGASDGSSAAVPPLVWLVLLGVFLMSANHAITLSFIERVGAARDYGLAFISVVLTTMGFVKLFPAAFAAVLDKRISVRRVLLLAPVTQGVCALMIFSLGGKAFFAVGAPLFIAVLLFANIFAFGLVSRLDRGGRAVAAHPSVMLIGTGLGAFVGGWIVKNFGYETLGFAVAGFAAMALLCFLRVPGGMAPPEESPEGAIQAAGA